MSLRVDDVSNAVMRRDNLGGCERAHGGFRRRGRGICCMEKPMWAVLALPAAACLLFILMSPASAQDAQPPARPTGVTASTTSEAVTLAWDEPDDDSITGYQVLRRARDAKSYGDDQGAPVFAVIADDTGSAEAEYRDSSVSPGTRYVYRVKARNARGLSPWSSYVNAETLTAPAIHAKDAVPKSDTDACPDGTPPTPTAVPVDAVPIVVTSTTAEYFVLYVSHVVDSDTTVEIPVAVTRGAAGTTALTENVEALPKVRYRVEKYLVTDPADIDGDCIDDITELGNPATMNPVNPAAAIAIATGAVAVPSLAAFDTISRGETKFFGKFIIFGLDTDRPGIYFQNTNNYLGHERFLQAVDMEWDASTMIDGFLFYDPDLTAPDGSPGLYYAWVHQIKPFNHMALYYSVLAASMGALNDNLAIHLPNQRLPYHQSDLPAYKESRVNLLFDSDVESMADFQALNKAEGFGLLRVMGPDDVPRPRDIAIFETLPNELPRVAGIVSTVQQTPLSHVNLRAVQDGVPNAFIRNALETKDIAALVGSHVRYTVADSGYTFRAATRAEVDAHYAASRPATAQTPARDLSVTAIASLSQVGFTDWDAFGVKAANVAVLGGLGFPAGTVPDGFAIPFHFYDEFMKANNLYNDVREMLADEDFQNDYDKQEGELKKLRKKIKDADTPQWIVDALTAMHATYPDGQSLRYRSSTNNEDLPGFNGAGLYDSKTQKPDETEEDGIDKSLKQVYASLWNFRAFIERDFHRIDHLAAAMGVLVHPNYTDEMVNGVAVSDDTLYGRDGKYYINSQVGEDLVTNPGAHSIPEEILLDKDGTYEVVITSNQVPAGQLLMTEAQLQQLRRHLGMVHARFKALYEPAPGEPFAMEIEFKITSANQLAIKQARPWVFRPTNGLPEFPSTESGLRTLPENTGQPTGRPAGAPVTAVDPDPDDVLSYYLVGTDARFFDIMPETGTLLTRAVLDYETQATYSVTVFVRDGKNEHGHPNTTYDDWINVNIVLTNEDEVGTLVLSSEQPYPGTPLIATLTDPDGSIAGSTWLWRRSANGTSAWTTIEGAITPTYTPTEADGGNYLRATASYTDGHGSSKVASGVSANPVEEASSPPPPKTGGGGGFGPAPVAPKFSDGFRTTRSVTEHARPGGPIGDPVDAAHPDDLEITYSLSGADAVFFSVDEQSGQLRVKEGVDLTVGRTYTANLTATDSSGVGAIIIVIVEVTEARLGPLRPERQQQD